jgi:hypothetical protein
MNYINFYPGTTREERELSLDADEAYGADDIVGLVDSMIKGSTSSAPVEGARAALEDGSLWSELCNEHGDTAVQEALEELHSLLVDADA